MSVETEIAKLIDDSTRMTKWNRRQALFLLQKANEVEERAANIANSLRATAAAFVIEARENADDVADYIEAEFPLIDPNNEEKDDE